MLRELTLWVYNVSGFISAVAESDVLTLSRCPFYALLLCSAGLIPAQQPQPKVDLESHSSAVLLDVVVQSSNQAPVQNLHAQDFRLFDDGKEQKINYFEEHFPEAQHSVDALPPLPLHVYTNIPPQAASDAVNIFLIDSLNMTPPDFAFARMQILAFLRKIPPGTRIAIYTLGQELRLVQDFTEETSLLAKAINSQRTDLTLSSSAASASGISSSSPAISKSEYAATAINRAFEHFAQYDHENRQRMTIEALGDIARALSKIPERKNLIWFTSDFPFASLANFSDDNNSATRNAASNTAQLLAANRIAIYPVSTLGILRNSLNDAGNSALSTNPFGSIHNSAAASDYALESAHNASIIASMNQLAEDTGGLAFYNTNDIDMALDHAVRHGSHYYTLAFTPAQSESKNPVHKLDLQLPGKNFKLYFRHSYSTQVQFPSNRSPLNSLLRFGKPDSSQILFAARVLPADSQPEKTSPPLGELAKQIQNPVRFNVNFVITPTDLSFASDSLNHHTGKLDLALCAYDQNGKIVNWIAGTQNLDLSNALFDTVARTGIPALLQFDLPAKTPVELYLGVYDQASGHQGTLHIAMPSEATILHR